MFKSHLKGFSRKFCQMKPSETNAKIRSAKVPRVTANKTTQIASSETQTFHICGVIFKFSRMKLNVGEISRWLSGDRYQFYHIVFGGFWDCFQSIRSWFEREFAGLGERLSQFNGREADHIYYNDEATRSFLWIPRVKTQVITWELRR